MDQTVKNTSVVDGPITKAQYRLLVDFMTSQTLPENEEIRRAGFVVDPRFREQLQQAPARAPATAHLWELNQRYPACQSVESTLEWGDLSSLEGA